MRKKIYGSSLLIILVMVTLVGCDKPTPKPVTPSSLPSGTDPKAATSDLGRRVAQVHWLGKKRISAENNATNFMAIWNLPESAKLEAQTLDKLSTAPWRLLPGVAPLSNAPAALLRPLLDDLVREESYLEIWGETNRPASIGLAIRLDAARAALWRTNIPVILASLYPGSKAPDSNVAASDFGLQTPEFDFALSRSGDWTLFSIADFQVQTPGDPHKLSAFHLISDVKSRVERDHTPFLAGSTNYWLEAAADLRALAGWIHFPGAFRPSPSFLGNLPRLTLTLIGDGQNIRTRGELDFPGPIPMELEQWNIPTNLVHDPLIGFMAVRGIRPWLQSLKLWNEAKLGTPPNQVFFWAQDGLPALRFFALPSAEASNQLHLFSEFLLTNLNPLFASSSTTNGVRYGVFERVPDTQRLRWRGVPYIMPSLDLNTNGRNSFIIGGLFRNSMTNQPVPGELLRQFQIDPNLALYDWENSQLCETGLLQMTQLGRLIFGRARLSLTNNASLPWLVAISPKLGITGTSIRLADMNRLTISRSSTLGFTGAELHLLADWLESPLFPKGFFTLDAKPTPFRTDPTPPTAKAP